MKPRKKSFRMFILAVLMIVILTGCVDAHMHITVNLDGSGTYEIKVLSNPLVVAQFAEFKKQLEQEGYQIRDVEENGKKGWVAVKEVDDLAKEPPLKEMEDSVNSAIRAWAHQVASSDPTALAAGAVPFDGLGEGFRVENSFLTTRIVVDTDADMTHLKQGAGNEFGGLENLIFDQMNLNFILTLPIEVKEHNATSVSPDGKTLTWKLKPGEKNPIHMMIEIPNFVGWGILLGGILLLLVLIAIFVIVALKKKRRKRDDDGYFPPGGDSSSSSPESFHWG